MCFDGGLFESLLIPVIGGIFGGILGNKQAESRNDAIDQQKGNTEDAAKIQAQQLAAQRDIEIQKQQTQSNQIRGRLRAIAAEAGTGFGDTQQALEGAVIENQSLNTSIIERNLQNNLEANRLGLRGQLLQLDSGTQDPTLAGLTGALSGFGSGLNFGSGLSSLLQPPVKPRAPYQPGYYTKNGLVGSDGTGFGGPL